MNAEEDFNWSQEATKFIANNYEKLSGIAKTSYRFSEAKIKARLEKTYSSYLQKIWVTYSRGQSFFVRSPTYIYDFYVALPIRQGLSNRGPAHNRVSKPSINDCFKSSNAIVITGGGGSGKSMFLRHLMLDCLFKSFGIPIFVELRTTIEPGFPENIEDLLFDTVKAFDLDLTPELFHESLKLGHYVIFLDGFDELPEHSQNLASKEIQRIFKSYPKVRTLVASRPDDLFSGWHGFGRVQMAPLERDEAISFIENQKFDREIIELFTRELKGDVFEKHESFLSNPLLLTIMLLTYGQNAAIPSKLSEFYQNAFEALFQRHDALKGGYQRPRASGLDFADFGRVFSAFCVHSYFDKVVIFSESQLVEYAERAHKTTQKNFIKEEFIKDSIKAVCLLVNEGLRTVFAHRSFQEYFTAKFIAECSDPVATKLMDKLQSRIGYDSVHKLTHELKPSTVEVNFLAPKIREIRNQIGVKKSVGIVSFYRFLKRNYDALEIRNGTLYYSCKNNGSKNFQDHRVLVLAAKCCDIRITSTSKKFISKYGKSGTTVSYEVDKISSRHPLVKDLFLDQSVIGKKSLESLFKLPELIERKEQQRIGSLDEII